MTKEEYDSSLRMCWLMAKAADEIATDQILQLMSTAETTTPMLDPTLWIQKGRQMQEDKKIVEAVANLRGVFRKMKEEHGTPQSRHE